MRAKVILGVALVAIAALVYVLFFRGSDEDKIRQVIGKLAHAAELKPDANPLLRAARLRSDMDELVTPDVHVNVDELPGGTRAGRPAVVELASQAPLAYRSVDVDVHDLEIKLDPSHTTATVGARTTVRGDTRAGETRRDERAVDFLVRKDDGVWRVSAITVWPPGEAR